MHRKQQTANQSRKKEAQTVKSTGGLAHRSLIQWALASLITDRVHNYTLLAGNTSPLRGSIAIAGRQSHCCVPGIKAGRGNQKPFYNTVISMFSL